MKTRFLKPITLLVAMIFMAMSACAHPTSQPAEQQEPPRPLADTIEVMSQAMGRNIKNVVILPLGYYDSTNMQYPVLYLLHGALTA